MRTVPTMTPHCVHEYLGQIGANWHGWGVAVECGCWLGASCIALANGLRRAGYDRALHCYDNWRANASQVGKASAQGHRIGVGDDLEPLFWANVLPVYDRLETHQGDLARAHWGGAPIEIFILDAAKREPTFSRVLRTFSPAWIPGVTLVGLLDYHYYRGQPPAAKAAFECQRRFVEAHPGSLELLMDFGEQSASAFFQYQEPLKWD